MQKQLTITLDEHIYEGLSKLAGRRKINQFIETLLRSHVKEAELEEGYRQMAADEEYEAEALEWIEGTIGDVSDEAR